MRFTASAVCVAAGATLIDFVAKGPLHRQLANATGLALFQALLFHFTLPIQWKSASQRLDHAPSQFGISDVVLATSAAAFLFALFRLSAPQEMNRWLYWSVALISWFTMPVIASFTFRASINQYSRIRRSVMLASAIAISVGLATLLALAQTSFDQRLAEFSNQHFLPGYLQLLGSYLMGLIFVAFAAKTSYQRTAHARPVRAAKPNQSTDK